MRKNINNLVNFFFSAMVRVLLWLGIFPGVWFGRWRFRKGCLIKDFTPIHLGNWGSATDDTNCAFSEKNVCVCGNNYLITTKKEFAVGIEYWGNPTPKDFTSGCMVSDSTFSYGTFSCEVTLSGLWDSFWVLHDFTNGYWEFDGIECLKDGNLTSSVHSGLSSAIGRVKHTNGYRQPGNHIHVAMKIRKRYVRAYVNGICVFVGMIYRPRMPVSLIFSSGLQPRHEIRRNHYTIFKNIKYHEWTR